MGILIETNAPMNLRAKSPSIKPIGMQQKSMGSRKLLLQVLLFFLMIYLIAMKKDMFLKLLILLMEITKVEERKNLEMVSQIELTPDVSIGMIALM